MEPKAGNAQRSIAPGLPGGAKAQPFSLARISRWGWRLCLMEPWLFLFSLFVAVGVQLLAQWNVQLLSNMLSLVGGSRRSGLAQTAILLVAATCLLLVMQFLDRIFSVRTDIRLLRRLQILLHERIHAVSLKYHEAHEATRLQMTVLNYATGAETMLKEVAAFPIVRTISLGSALYLLWRNFASTGNAPLWMRIALFGALLTLPLVVLRFSRKVRFAFQDVQKGNADTALRLGNSLRSPVEVRCLGISPLLAKAFRKALDGLSKAKTRASIRNETLNQFQNAVPTVLQLLFLMAAAWQILHAKGTVQVGALLAVYYFVPTVVAPLREMVSFYSGLQASWPQVSEVVELLEQPDDPLEPKRGDALPDAPGSIEIRKAAFRYADGGPAVLSDLDAEFPEGKITAVVGKSGSGKSTVLALVSRQLAAESGKILIGGKELSSIASGSLRSRMFKASQFPLFVTGSLKENLLLVAPEATEAQMERACREVGLWDAFLRSGGDIPPLERPMPTDPTKGLSGGERKRFVLARAILASPQLLLLDEPTSGLAPSDRREIAAVIRRHFAGRTVLIVDHDMEFVRETADFVLCLEQGRAGEFGTPEELLGRDSHFRRLLQESSSATNDGLG